MKKQSNILITESSADYALVDSGEGEKLERFGQITLARPDPQALWHKRLHGEIWKKADGHFDSSWNIKKDMPAQWPISFGGLKFWIRPSSFKHVGLFPEQAANWEWLKAIIAAASARGSSIEILNLFGYTGGATLTASQAGAKVVHVDGSKVAIAWARENAEASGLKDRPIRWILDDAHAFVKREAKRGRRYQGIVMDPPAFGHGPKNELWKIEEHLLPLIDDCFKIMADTPLFFLINGYSAGYSALAYDNLLLPIKERFGGAIEIGELSVKETGSLGRLLPCGIFGKWSR